jgi:4-amino-4-deoxy-L-arabinose transferase-like glycosyltransferase
VGLYAGFVVLFFGGVVSRSQSKIKGLLALIAAIAAAILLGSAYYGSVRNDTDRFGNGTAYVQKFRDLAEGRLPDNVTQRLDDWKLYGRWIAENPKTLLFGHATPPPRQVITSAHNWYIDYVYNFGLLGLLPVLALIGFTAWRLWRQPLPADVRWLAGFVAFLVLVDSSFKVTLRQPYSGIFGYFLWGLLLHALNATPVHLLATKPTKMHAA